MVLGIGGFDLSIVNVDGGHHGWVLNLNSTDWLSVHGNTLSVTFSNSLGSGLNIVGFDPLGDIVLDIKLSSELTNLLTSVVEMGLDVVVLSPLLDLIINILILGKLIDFFLECEVLGIVDFDLSIVNFNGGHHGWVLHINSTDWLSVHGNTFSDIVSNSSDWLSVHGNTLCVTFSNSLGSGINVVGFGPLGDIILDIELSSELTNLLTGVVELVLNIVVLSPLLDLIINVLILGELIDFLC